MESLLSDLELDIQELKYLINTLSKQKDPTLRLMAERRMKQIRVRLDKLTDLLNEPSNIIAGSNDRMFASEENIILDNFLVNETVVTAEKINPDEATVTAITTKSEVVEADKPEEKEVKEENQEQQTRKLGVDLIYLTQTIHSGQKILAEQLKPAVNIAQSFSLNDVFRFSNELFDGNQQRMNEVLNRINSMESWNEVQECLSTELKADDENEVLADFSDCLKKFFA